MDRNNNPSAADVSLAAEIVFSVLKTANVSACLIGSTAISYSTRQSFGRNPNILPFLNDVMIGAS
ncbi:hypothetical protein BDV93DRAFT_246584 [Ceratobasidium sp. AG-I]|nr:hypothetical protein BDV93DRAFT_246584 [Ceratobasidium sp. AG-I]